MTVLIAALCLFGLALSILAVPVHLRFRLGSQGKDQGANDNRVQIEWAFGLVRTNALRTGDGAPHVRDATVPRAAPSSMPLRAFLQHKHLFGRLMRLARNLWHALDKRDVQVRLRLGLGDPADTGQLWALVGPLAGLLAAVRDVSICVSPDFTESAFELEGSGHLRLVPLQALFLVLPLVFSPSLWRGVMATRDASR